MVRYTTRKLQHPSKKVLPPPTKLKTTRPTQDPADQSDHLDGDELHTVPKEVATKVAAPLVPKPK
jgi:hypothetical protein